MTAISYADVFSIVLDHADDEEILPGDVVRTGANHFPHFEVIAVHRDTAWLRDLQTGADHLAPLKRCRRILVARFAVAAE